MHFLGAFRRSLEFCLIVDFNLRTLFSGSKYIDTISLYEEITCVVKSCKNSPIKNAQITHMLLLLE